MSILDAIDDAVRAIESMREEKTVHFLEEIADALVECFTSGGKVLVAGNGGSICEAMHFAEELTGFYRQKRPALPAIALSDPAHMSCVANDIGYEYVFSRMIEALGKENDLFIALTTSGNSQNLIEAALSAKKKKIKVIGFLGKEGGRLKSLCDHYWIVKGFGFSDRIQEAHLTAIHILIQRVEESLFYNQASEKLKIEVG